MTILLAVPVTSIHAETSNGKGIPELQNGLVQEVYDRIQGDAKTLSESKAYTDTLVDRLDQLEARISQLENENSVFQSKIEQLQNKDEELEEADAGIFRYIQSFTKFFDSIFDALNIPHPDKDTDGDGIPDSSDPFPNGEDTRDSDMDGYPDINDQAPFDSKMH